MTPEEARQLLENFLQEKEQPPTEEETGAAVHMEMQLLIVQSNQPPHGTPIRRAELFTVMRASERGGRQPTSAEREELQAYGDAMWETANERVERRVAKLGHAVLQPGEVEP